MKSFPSSYTPQSGYPTQGPYSPGGEQKEQPPLVNPQGPPPQETQVELPPQPPQPSYMPQVIPPPPLQPTGYSYYPQQQQMMGQYPPAPQYPPQPQYPPRPQYPPQPDYYSDSDNDDDDNPCHEVIGITMGGKPSPLQDPVVCCDCRAHSKLTTKEKKCRQSKLEEKPQNGESLCAHAFCIIERAKIKPAGMPWASGQNKYQQSLEEPTKIKVIRKKCKCHCKKKVEVESDSDEEEDTHSLKSSNSSTNSKKHIKAFMEVFCSLLDKSKNKSGKKGNNGSGKSAFCCDC